MKTNNFFKLLDEKFELVSCIIMMSLFTLLLFFQVVMRYIFNNSLTWTEELSRYLFIWLVYMGISYSAKQKQHIKVEALMNIFPKKSRPYVVIIGDVLFLAFSILIVFAGSRLVFKEIILKQKSPAMGIPMAIVYAAPVVGFALTAFRQIQVIIFRKKHFKYTPEGSIEKLIAKEINAND
ncbi:MAG: TRAP transporter small permease [Peptostreptococcaceae bacterium]|nr:TRAP transporter small permease [Peptostreptococcaceae bacterium]